MAADRASGYLRQVGVEADVRSPVGSLSMSERTAVAIARALSDTGQRAAAHRARRTDGRPAAGDVDRLLEAIGRLRAEGHGVLLVSHHLGEVLDIADRITVLRDGRVAASVPRRRRRPARADRADRRPLRHRPRRRAAPGGAAGERDQDVVLPGRGAAQAAGSAGSTSTSTPARSWAWRASPGRAVSRSRRC